MAGRHLDSMLKVFTITPMLGSQIFSLLCSKGVTIILHILT